MIPRRTDSENRQVSSVVKGSEAFSTTIGEPQMLGRVLAPYDLHNSPADKIRENQIWAASRQRRAGSGRGISCGGESDIGSAGGSGSVIGMFDGGNSGAGAGLLDSVGSLGAPIGIEF